MTTETPPKPKSRKKAILGCLGLVFIVSVLCCGYDLYQVNQIERYIAEAVAARDQGDCVRAIELYDQGINSQRIILGDTEIKEAQAGRQVCEAYLDVVALQDEGRLGEALVGYDAFINQHPNNPIHTPVRNQAQTIFASAQADTIADASVCQNLDSILENELVPDPETHLPLFYIGCGQVFYDAGDYSQAVAMLQKFTTDYPDHPRQEEIEPLFAAALVAEARALGAGDIPPPQATGGGSSGGPAVVIIQNDSPEEMSLVFTGPETRFETLAPCESCQSFQNTGPANCPEQGPIGTYELPPGTYDVVVKSISDTGVTPFTGRWDLTNGEEYYSCFFLITSR